MRVQQVLMPDGSGSWTVLDEDGEPVPTVEAFLAHLQALDRSPTTLRTLWFPRNRGGFLYAASRLRAAVS